MNERPKQSDSALCADNVDLRSERLKVRFLFARFALAHDMTERTRVRTVKRLGDGFA